MLKFSGIRHLKWDHCICLIYIACAVEQNRAKIEIPLARQRLRTVIYICALIVAFATYWILTGHSENATSIGFTGILALCVVIVGLKKIRKELVGLIIDGSGITNYSSDVGSFRVTWEEITEFKTVFVNQSPYIMIMVKDPEKIIATKSGITAFLMRSNHKMYGTPLNIALYSLHYNGDDLLEKLEAILDAHLNHDSES